MSSSEATAEKIRRALRPGGALSQLLPLYEYREEQERACLDIATAMATKKHCLIEAGTGVGKTMSYLIPAVLAAADGRRTVISTHTIALQTQLLEKDIPLAAKVLTIIDPRARLNPALAKGRGNYLCLQNMDLAQEDMLVATDPQFARVRAWAAGTTTGDRADLPVRFGDWHEIASTSETCRREECRYFDKCFYYAMRHRLQSANIIVINHALFLLDIVSRQSDGRGILPQYDHVVFDEAHHLEDAATDALSIELASNTIPRYLERMKRHASIEIEPGELEGMELLSKELFSAIEPKRQEFYLREVLQGEDGDLARAQAKHLSEGLRRIVAALTVAANGASQVEIERLEGLAKSGDAIVPALDLIFLNPSAEYIQWGEISGHGRRSEPVTTLYSTPIRVDSLLHSAVWENQPPAVLTSATLATSGGFAYIRGRLGLPPDTLESIIGSPFDFKRQALLYVPREMPSPKAVSPEQFAAAAATVMQRLVTLTDGRAFLLFTSRKMLDAVYEILLPDLRFPLFRQDDMPPGKLLQAYRASGNGCLLGLRSFWEGVDVQGSALSAVVIDRLPFQVPDSPVTVARTDAVRAGGGDWFRDYSIPIAQIRLKQGFGRLIRTRTDKGIVCILDSRLLHAAYGRDFVAALPPARRASEWSRVEAFWNEAAEACQPVDTAS